MYSLNTLIHPLVSPLWYPQRIRNFVNIQYEERTLQRPYINCQLDYDLSYCWSYKKPIVIKAPTGSGKTWFVIKKVVRRAIKRSEYVLIITNRCPLNLSYKQELAKITGKDGLYTPEGLQGAYEFGNVYIINYQGLKSFLHTHSNIKFSYVICDECHYFLQDATFSDCSGSALDMIPRKFESAIRIYISATIDEVLPYITRAELYDCNVNCNGDVFLKNLIYPQFPTGTHLLPVIYRMDSDYSKVKLQFYENIDFVTDYLKTQKSQVMAFCSSKKECKKIGDAIGDSLVIDSPFLHSNPEVLKSLIEKEGFDEKCLATTSVFSNGNNVCKKSVRSVIITLLDQTELIQMAGRRRLDYCDSNDGFTLYLPIPTLSQLQQELHRIYQFQEDIKKCKQSPIYLMKIIKDGGEYAEQIRNVFEVDSKTEKYKINYLCEDKLYSEIKYLNFIYALISDAGKEAYCAMIASLFGKEFDESMLFSTLEDRKEAMKSFIHEYGFPLSESEFENFKADFLTERLKLFGAAKADNTGSSRKSPGITAINRRLLELNIDIQIERKDEAYILTDAESEVTQ